jgi:hypothetical protein
MCNHTDCKGISTLYLKASGKRMENGDIVSWANWACRLCGVDWL